MIARAQQRVGGRYSLRIPPGETAGAWLIRADLADLFIGYAHYARQMLAADDLRTLVIPSPWNIQADYQLTMVEKSHEAQQLCRFILGSIGQHYLQQAGFLSVSDGS